MARVLLVTHSLTPVLTAAIAEMEAASHAVTCVGFAEAIGRDTDVVLVVAGDNDIASVKQLARGSAPVIAIADRSRTASQCERHGAVWAIPSEPYLGTSLTEGMCSVNRALIVKPMLDDDPQLKAMVRGNMDPAGVNRKVLEDLEAQGLQGKQQPTGPLNRRQRRRKEARNR